MKDHKEADVTSWESDGVKYYSLFVDQADFVEAWLPWQSAGLQQTATGYGRKLTTHRKVSFEGKLYRVYATCFSNVASHWFVTKGRKIFVN